MGRFAQILTIALGVCALAASNGALDAQAADAKKPAVKVAKFDFAKEFKALEDAAELLSDVHDEKEAQKAAKKITAMFNMLPPPMGGEEEQLEAWAAKANLLNRQMERLRKEKWFVSSGLQEAWTTATDPFSRRRAATKKK